MFYSYYIVYFNFGEKSIIFNSYYEAKKFCDTFHNEDSFIIERNIKK